MSVIINFTSPGNPPNNISSFQVHRSKRTASGSIASSPDINNTTKVVTVTFDSIPANDLLVGDQMHIGGLLYTIAGNTSTTITFSTTTDLSTITSFPASFIVLNDLAEFADYEVVGVQTPVIPFNSYFIHQFSDSSGTIFDFYKIKTSDNGGTVSKSFLTNPFRPGQVINLALDEKRSDPKDSLKGIIGGTLTFEVELIMGGRRQDPKDNIVFADIYAPSYLSNNASPFKLDTIQLSRVGLARYKATWTVPASVTSSQGNLSLFPSTEYFIAYKANFYGVLDTSADAMVEFESEFFELGLIDGPISGRFPSYATTEDMRFIFFAIDSYLPESIAKTDLEKRNKLLNYHLETASDKLREELNLHQIRANSSDRKEYVAARAIYTVLMAAKGQNGSAISTEFLREWKDRFEDILEQLKREGVYQAIPMGRG